MEKTELGDEFCWFGEGLWRTNMVWGESSKGLKCTKHGLREADALDAYCLGDDSSHDLFSDRDVLCETVRWGRFLMSFGACLSFLGGVLIIAVHFTTSLKTRALRLKRALFVMVLSFVSYSALFSSMAASPMFDAFHFHFLGRHNRVQYKGLGCVFQSPFVGGLTSLLTSSPLKCLYPGPAFVMTLGVTIFQFMGCLILLSLLFDTWRRLKPEGTEVNKPGPSTTMYSLHGAMMRRLSQFHRLEQNLIGILFPFFVIGNAMLLVSWFYHGMQFLVHVRVHNNQRPSSGDPLLPIPAITIVELREQVFTFDPVTTLKDFWEGKGYLLTVVTSFWLDFFPFLKVFIWLYYWFVPQSEVTRGRVLTWIDYLGKWSLANLFCLCLISVGFLFQSKIILPIPLPDKQVITIEIECIVESGAGVSWFIVCLLWTVALGDIFLQAHTVARKWEEERRKQSNLSSAAPGLPLLAEGTSSEEAGLDNFVRLETRCEHALEEDTPILAPLLSPSNNGESLLDNSQLTSSSSARSESLPRRGSLFREMVRRTSAQFMLPSSPSDRKEALCQGAFAPIPNIKHKFSARGLCAVWFALITILALTILALGIPVVHLERDGAVPEFLLNEPNSDLSVANLVNKVNQLGGSERPAYELAIAFVLFSLVFPLVHTLALMVLWAAPMTVRRQRLVFRLVEFCDAWNALDVFFAATFIVWVGVESISRSVVEIVVPGLTAAARDLIGMSDVFVIVPTIQPGFWYLLVALIGQKLTSHILMELTAATIAHRQFALDHAQVIATPSGDNQRLVVEEHQILSAEQLLMFSPAARYVGVTGIQTAKVIYAGLPRWVWRGGVALGFMDVEDD
jgi:hypothetical protein